jgi:hypothetical protein
MSLIYSDSFQDDEDLCNVLAALRFGCRATSFYDPGTVVDKGAGNIYDETPASGPSLSLHNQPSASIASPVGKYPCFPLKPRY